MSISPYDYPTYDDPRDHGGVHNPDIIVMVTQPIDYPNDGYHSPQYYEMQSGQLDSGTGGGGGGIFSPVKTASQTVTGCTDCSGANPCTDCGPSVTSDWLSGLQQKPMIVVGVVAVGLFLLFGKGK